MSLALETFEAERGRLFGLAYRMLGSASEAEEVLQDAWLRAQAAAGPIHSPAGFLTTLVARLCLDRHRSARARREVYVGPWLPEPILTPDLAAHAGDLPDEALARAESVSMAFLRILEQLSPVERAVFLLREAFDYGHEQIAEALAITPANSRQILSRARERVAGGEPRYERDPAVQRQVVEAFLRAASSGDPQRVVELLHPDVEWTSDGGGLRPAMRRPLIGQARVAQVVAGLFRKGSAGLRMEIARVNASTAVVLHGSEGIETVIGADVREGRIARIWAIRNPEKLAYLARQLG